MTNNKKIICRQVKPDIQESPLFLGDEFWPENILVLGNRDFKRHTDHSKYGELYERIEQSYDEMCKDYEQLKDKETSWYKNVTELFHDYFSKSEFDAINVNLDNKKIIHEFKLLLDKQGTKYYYDGKVEIDMLSFSLVLAGVSVQFVDYVNLIGMKYYTQQNWSRTKALKYLKWIISIWVANGYLTTTQKTNAVFTVMNGKMTKSNKKLLMHFV